MGQVATRSSHAVDQAETALNKADDVIAKTEQLRNELEQAGDSARAARVGDQLDEMRVARDEGRGALNYAKQKDSEINGARDDLDPLSHSLDEADEAAENTEKSLRFPTPRMRFSTLGTRLEPRPVRGVGECS